MVLSNKQVDVGNAEVEVKVVGETRSNQSDEFGRQGSQQHPYADGKEKLFCSQASDLGIEMARECCSISEDTYLMEDLSKRMPKRLEKCLMKSVKLS